MFKKNMFKTKLSLIKLYFIEWSQNFSGNGYPKIFKSKLFIFKIIWTVSLLTSVSLCFYLITQSIMDYLNYSTNSKIEVTHAVPIEFPQIDICNSNAFISTHDVSKNILINQRIPEEFNSDLGPYFIKVLNLNSSNLDNESDIDEYVRISNYLKYLIIMKAL
jgi:hypothetical protein